ncbi:hypothetical protein NP493_1542g00026 [Ridgeia piscesae]|uniref:DNA topoisomerase (ATP-hydrolyzing) n=1 Tax=Ridgeia piscesae TaxID=27915 RepID=A0AAD9K047_RIDPI|nr:hypothetical protein NP493_1542g00026 [Ridgeia piscesae]
MENTEIWRNINDLRNILLQEGRIHTLRQQCIDSDSSSVVNSVLKNTEHICRENILRLIEEIFKGIMVSLSKDEPPCLVYNSRRNWQDVRFQEGCGLEMAPGNKPTVIRFNSVQSINKFSLTVKVLSLMHRLIQNNSYCTKRDLFYQDPQLFGSQAYVDGIVDNISCMLHVPRWHLRVMATSKGCIAGDLQFRDADASYVDCSQTSNGILIPSHVTGITSLTSSAKVVLLVEKDATFQTLLDDNVCQKLAPCIIITGKGFPDMNTRLMVKKLWDTFQLPTLALVDADPHGFEIMAVYKFGSRSLSFEAANLTVPAVRWLGVLPSDIDRLHIPRSALIPLTTADKDKAQELLKRPYMSSQATWKHEIDILLKLGMKAEIQCLSAISPSFLTDVYLLNKIQYGSWI